MHTSRSLWATLALISLAPAAHTQGGGRGDGPALPDVVPGTHSQARGGWLAVDGQPAAPGRVPEGTSDEARQRFGELAGRLTSAEAVRSFALRFDVEIRTDSGSNEARKTELRYLDQDDGYVYGAFLNADGSVKQAQMRGPKPEGPTAYWQVLKDGSVLSLIGKDYSESRDELDGWAALCHDLLLIQQPARLRLMRMEARRARLATPAGVGARTLVFGEDDAVVLPDEPLVPGDRSTSIAQRAAQLVWLEIVTPDVRVWREAPGESAARRVLLGLDPALALPEFALITGRTEGPLVAPGAALMQLSDWHRYGNESADPNAATGHWLPRETRLFELREALGAERELNALAFKNRASIHLFVLPGGTLGGPPLPIESFRPAK